MNSTQSLKFSFSLFAIVFSALLTAGLTPRAAYAELQLPKPSPLASVMQRVGVTDIEVTYSSPGKKDRQIWGALVPYDKIWRTGANACTKVSFSKASAVAGKDISAGEYCLFTIPGEKKWTVIFNKDTSLAGDSGYDESKDALRVELSPGTAPLRENMTFVFGDTKADSTSLRLEWDSLALAIPITTDTTANAMENIRTLDSSAWRDYADAASFVLSTKEDSAYAMELVEKSLTLEKTWYNNWIKAQILAEQGQSAEAIASAKEAKSLGDGSNFFKFFEPQIDKALQGWTAS